MAAGLNSNFARRLKKIMNESAKQRAVGAYSQTDTPIREIARMCGISTQTLLEWVKASGVKMRGHNSNRPLKNKVTVQTAIREHKPKMTTTADFEEREMSNSPLYQAMREYLADLFKSNTDWWTQREIKDYIEDTYLADLLDSLESDGIIEVDRSNVQITRYRLKPPEEIKKPKTKKRTNDFHFPVKVNKSKYIYNGNEVYPL